MYRQTDTQQSPPPVDNCSHPHTQTVAAAQTAAVVGLMSHQTHGPTRLTPATDS